MTAASEAARTLAAGGIVPAGTALGKGDIVDTVVARAYRHPVLGDRVVVRLTAENVAAGDDLEMSVLGFGAGESRGAVGVERRRPLGFPAWALVHESEKRALRARCRRRAQAARAAREEQARLREGGHRRARREARQERAAVPAVVL